MTIFTQKLLFQISCQELIKMKPTYLLVILYFKTFWENGYLLNNTFLILKPDIFDS